MDLPLKSKLRGASARPGSAATCSNILPVIKITDTQIHCNHQSLDLSKRPMTLRLVIAFCQAQERPLSKEELVDVVYSPFDPQSKSARFRWILGQNVTKLVSRARLIMEAAFNPKGTPWIEFFPYDTISNAWNFYRLKNRYIGEQELVVLNGRIQARDLQEKFTELPQ